MYFKILEAVFRPVITLREKFHPWRIAVPVTLFILLISFAATDLRAYAGELDDLMGRLVVSTSPSRRQWLISTILYRIAQMKDKSPDAAVNAYRELIAMLPENKEAHYRLGYLLYSKGKYDEAVSVLEDAVSIDDKDRYILDTLAYSLMKSGRFEEAVECFEKLSDQEPENPFPVINMGHCFMNSGKIDAAISAWEEAMELLDEGPRKAELQKIISNAKESKATGKDVTLTETRWFMVEFPGDSHYDMGAITLDFLNEVFLQVTSDLRFRPQHKIVVVFSPSTEFHEKHNAKSWVYAFAKTGKIYMPLKAGYADIEWMKGVLAHEFTHVIFNLMVNSIHPLWLNEGMAVFQESKASFGDPYVLSAHRKKVFDEMIVKAGREPDLETLSFSSSEDELDEITLCYVASYLAVRYLVEKHGIEILNRILIDMGQGMSAKKSIENITGMSFEGFQKSMYKWARGL